MPHRHQPRQSLLASRIRLGPTNWSHARKTSWLALTTLASDPNISGDGFWALQPHVDKFGSQPIPVDAQECNDAKSSPRQRPVVVALLRRHRNSGQLRAKRWRARTQKLRTHAYAMAGMTCAAARHTARPCHHYPRACGIIRLARFRRLRQLYRRTCRHPSEWGTRLRSVRHRHRHGLG